jgi:hypothetical protein
MARRPPPLLLTLASLAPWACAELPPATTPDATAANTSAPDTSTTLDPGPRTDTQPGTTATDAIQPETAAWPAPLDLAPTCVPDNQPFAVPQLAKQSGDIGFAPWSPLRTAGVAEAVGLEVYQKGAFTPDPAAPTPTVTSDATVQVQNVEASGGGKFVAWLTFTAPGKRTLQAKLPDGRTGQAEVFVYATPLPVWRLDVAPAVFAQLHAERSDKTEQPCSLTVGGKTYQGATVRVHGGTSKDYPKRSLRIDLKPGDNLPDGRRKLILRAEWNDKTQLRNWLAFQFFRSFTWLPASRAEFVHLRMGGAYYGLMLDVQRIGGDFVALHGRDLDGNLYEADPPHTLGIPANLAPLSDPQLYPQVYMKHRGPADDYSDLRDLVEKTLLQNNALLSELFDKHMRRDDFLLYAAAMAVLQSTDHLRKNFYLYRDTNGPDTRWEMWPWDHDLTLGHLWNPQDDTLSEKIVTDLPLLTGLEEDGVALWNRMWRVLKIAAMRKQFEGYAVKLAQQVYATGWLDQRIAWATCRTKWDVLADTRKRATDAEYLQRVDEIRQFAKARLQFVQQAVQVP